MRQIQNGKKGMGLGQKADLSDAREVGGERERKSLEQCEKGRRVRDLNGPPSK